MMFVFIAFRHLILPQPLSPFQRMGHGDDTSGVCCLQLVDQGNNIGQLGGHVWHLLWSELQAGQQTQLFDVMAAERHSVGLEGRGDGRKLYTSPCPLSYPLLKSSFVFKSLPWRSMLKSFLGYFSNDLSIDLGTANTLIYVRGRAIVLNLSLIHI